MTENPVSKSNPVSEALTSINSLTDKQLEELGRSLSVGSLQRLNSKSLGTKAKGFMNKLFNLILLFTLAAVIAASFAYFFLKSNVAAGERKNDQANWGYSVDQYRFRDRMRLNLWSDSSMFSAASDATFDLNSVSVSKIVEEKWIDNGRAVLLNLLVKSGGKEQPAKLIYDFQRGEMYTASPLDLWRAPSEPGKNLKMNEEEFQATLNRLSGIVVAPPPAPVVAPSVADSVAPTAAPTLAPSVEAAPASAPKETAQ
jgi:hypothetical protein